MSPSLWLLVASGLVFCLGLAWLTPAGAVMAAGVLGGMFALLVDWEAE